MLPKYLLKNLCQANIQSGRGFCILFLCQRPDRSDHAGGIDFYLLQRHCAAVDALRPFCGLHLGEASRRELNLWQKVPVDQRGRAEPPVILVFVGYTPR